MQYQKSVSQNLDEAVGRQIAKEAKERQLSTLKQNTDSSNLNERNDSGKKDPSQNFDEGKRKDLWANLPKSDLGRVSERIIYSRAVLANLPKLVTPLQVKQGHFFVWKRYSFCISFVQFPLIQLWLVLSVLGL